MTLNKGNAKLQRTALDERKKIIHRVDKRRNCDKNCVNYSQSGGDRDSATLVSITKSYFLGSFSIQNKNKLIAQCSRRKEKG
jgi:hypothetical protein